MLEIPFIKITPERKLKTSTLSIHTQTLFPAAHALLSSWSAFFLRCACMSLSLSIACFTTQPCRNVYSFPRKQKQQKLATLLPAFPSVFCVPFSAQKSIRNNFLNESHARQSKHAQSVVVLAAHGRASE